MEWTDTLMLETATTTMSQQPESALDYTRVFAVEGVTLLYANVTSRPEISAALKLLQSFRATGRRVVLCDTTELVVGKQFGCEVVEDGSAELLISCGISGREVGIGARDAGLDLSSVVICAKPLAGGQVLASQLAPGDTVLLLGIDNETCDEVAGILANRFSRRAALAA